MHVCLDQERQIQSTLGMARHNHAPSTSAKKASLPSAFRRHRNVHQQCNQDQYLHSEEEEEKEKRKKKTKVRGVTGWSQYWTVSFLFLCASIKRKAEKRTKKKYTLCRLILLGTEETKKKWQQEMKRTTNSAIQSFVRWFILFFTVQHIMCICPGMSNWHTTQMYIFHILLFIFRHGWPTQWICTNNSLIDSCWIIRN